MCCRARFVKFRENGGFRRNSDRPIGAILAGMIPADEIETIARAVRAFLEPVWPEWHAAAGRIPEPLSRCTCGRSSLFLARVLEEGFGLAALWTNGTPRLAPGGPELGPFGFRAGGRWESHAWVVVSATTIVDVTADQFGAPAVIVAPLSDPRYGAGGDTALPEYRAKRHAAAEALWPRWRSSALRKSLVG